MAAMFINFSWKRKPYPCACVCSLQQPRIAFSLQEARPDSTDEVAKTFQSFTRWSDGQGGKQLAFLFHIGVESKVSHSVFELWLAVWLCGLNSTCWCTLAITYVFFRVCMMCTYLSNYGRIELYVYTIDSLITCIFTQAYIFVLHRFKGIHRFIYIYTYNHDNYIYTYTHYLYQIGYSMDLDHIKTVRLHHVVWTSLIRHYSSAKIHGI